MPNSNHSPAEPSTQSFDDAGGGSVGAAALLQVLWQSRFRMLLTCLLVGLVTVGVVALLYVRAPRVAASQSLLFTFDGAAQGRYPNGIAFSPRDMVAEPVLEAVFNSLHLEQWMKLSDLSSAITITEGGGTELMLLRLDYTQRLQNAKLSAPERAAMEQEFRTAAKRVGGGIYSLSAEFDDVSIPADVLQRVMTAVPDAWAAFAHRTRGLATYDIAVPTIAPLDSGATALHHLGVLTAELAALDRSSRELEALAGASWIRDRDGQLVSDLRRQVSVMRRVHYEPLVESVLRVAGRDALEQVSSNLENSRRTHEAAKSREAAARQNLEFYVASVRQDGAMVAGSQGQVGAQQDGRQQAMMAGGMPAMINLSDSFLNKMLEFGGRGSDLEYKQKLNDEVVEASKALVEAETGMRYDEECLKKLSAPAPESTIGVATAAGVIPARMLDLKHRMTDLATKSRGFLEIISQQNLNPGSMLYRLDGPMQVTSERAITARTAAVGFVGMQCLAVATGLLWSIVASHRRPRFVEEENREDQQPLPMRLPRAPARA